MLKTIHQILLLLLCTSSSVVPMRHIAQVASRSRLNPSLCLRSREALKCSLAPLVAIRCFHDGGIFDDATESTTADDTDSSSACLTRTHSDHKTTTEKPKIHERFYPIDNSLYDLHAYHDPTITLKIDESPSHSGQLDQAPTKPSWKQTPYEKEQHRLQQDTYQSQQLLSTMLARAEAEHRKQQCFDQLKSDYSSYAANFSSIVRNKTRFLTDSYASLSCREATAQRALLLKILRDAQQELTTLEQQNIDIYIDRDATPCNARSTSTPYRLSEKTSKHYQEALNALDLKSSIEAIKLATAYLDQKISAFNQANLDFKAQIDSASSDSIEKTILPELRAKKDAVDALIFSKESELSEHKRSLKNLEAYAEDFNSRPLRTRFIDRCVHKINTKQIQGILETNQKELTVKQEQTTRELQRLYDEQTEYTAQIEYAQTSAEQKRQAELQEAERLAQQQQELVLYNQQMAKSHYDAFSFDINDCPSLALEQQWRQRQEALLTTEKQGYQQYDQTFSISGQTAGFLAAHDIDHTKLQTFFGTALQQQFHGEICSMFEKAALLQQELPYQSNFLHSSVLLADAAYEANAAENIQLTIALNDASFQFLHTVQTYALAAAQGSAHGLLTLAQDCAHGITHPVEATQNFIQGVESLAKAVHYVFETVALNDCAQEIGFEDLYADLVDQRNAEITAGLQALGEKLSTSTGPEIIEALASFATNFYASGKVIHALGSALGAVQAELKAVKTIARKSVAAKKTTSDIGKFLQKIEEKITQQLTKKTSQELFRTTKKPKHPKKIARAAIEGSTGQPTQPRTAQQKAQDALRDAKKTAAKDGKIRDLPDGRIRYYEKEKFSDTPGPTRGRSFVTEWDPKTGRIRQWQECYDHAGNVNRVHPKMINGKTIVSQHYPATYNEIQNNIKGSKWLTPDNNLPKN